MYLYFDWGYLAVTYVAILGCVVVGADTAVFFTKFTQKERVVVIHSLFYLALLISGITALVGQSEYRSRIITYSESNFDLTKTVQTLPISNVLFHHILHLSGPKSPFISLGIAYAF